MSKSGSRYGRRSNWFKIHCLLQEQQHPQNLNQQKTSNKPQISPTMRTTNFSSTQFLSSFTRKTINYNATQCSYKRLSSPSDSGASSVDLDDSSGKTIGPQNSGINSLQEVMITKIHGVPEIGMEMLSPYLPLKCHSEKLRSTPLLFPSKILTSDIKHLEKVDEPIDLSVKLPPNVSSKTPLKSPTFTEISKTVPLDLTLEKDTNFSKLIS